MAESKKSGTDKIKTVNTRTTEKVKNTKAPAKSGAKTQAKGGKPAKKAPVAQTKKKGGTVLMVVGCVLAALVLLYCIIDISGPLFFSEFYSQAEKSVKIPGLNEAFVPQGFAYNETLGAYLVCGYMSNSEQSRLYVVDGGDGVYKELRLKNEDGSDYTGHAGGISCAGDDVFISNNKKIYHLNLDDITNARDLESIAFDGSFSVPCRSSFTFCDGEMLYVGEFYTDGYNTAEDHKLESADGTHSAFVFGYEVDGRKELGVAEPDRPDVVFSVCDKVQGFALTGDGRVILSCSYGLSNSELKIYDTSKAKVLHYDYNGNFAPLIVLDSECLENSVTMPLGSEDIDYHDGKVIIGYEFGAKKYGGGLIPFAIENIMLYTVKE